MKTIILTLIAIALAIPTFGISLVIWFWMKSKYDNVAVKAILGNAAHSFKNGGAQQILHGINNASINKVFSMFGDNYDPPEIGVDSGSGIIDHPTCGVMYLVLQQVQENNLCVSAFDLPQSRKQGPILKWAKREN